jgi:hypothetical protein
LTTGDKDVKISDQSIISVVLNPSHILELPDGAFKNVLSSIVVESLSDKTQELVSFLKILGNQNILTHQSS